jgi:NAD(P)-dependent dehydrogenase (short-subunit alcohol dehydrogenase family)
MKKAFITGTSSGLGRGLAANLIDRGWSVYGCSRRQAALSGLRSVQLDLAKQQLVPAALERLLHDAHTLDLVVLNAGILGEIRDIGDTPLDDLKHVMELNLWSNKTVLDWLLKCRKTISQIVLVSSGASVLGNRGWGGYALSKAALNMLTKLYAHEFNNTHLCALAPGLVGTQMMDQLCEQADAERFPAVERLQAARGTDAMPDPDRAARRVLSVLEELRRRPSGSFVDIREILDPQTYRALFGALSD